MKLVEFMRVKDMLDAIAANPSCDTINRFANETITNALPIAYKNAPHFDNINDCIEDATRQFKVLKEAINNDEDKLLMFRVDIEPVDFFKSAHPKAYKELEELINDSTKR